MTNPSCHPDLRRFWELLAEGSCAGQPLLPTLRSIEKALPPAPMGKVAGLLADAVSQGIILSVAMRNQPSVFSKAHVSLVEGGELLGISDRVFLLILEFVWRCPACANIQFPGVNATAEPRNRPPEKMIT